MLGLKRKDDLPPESHIHLALGRKPRSGLHTEARIWTQRGWANRTHVHTLLAECARSSPGQECCQSEEADVFIDSVEKKTSAALAVQTQTPIYVISKNVVQ